MLVQVTLNEAMVSGEFFSQSTLYAAAPDFTPRPYGWGTYASDPGIHFFLCNFVDMDEDTLPDTQKFVRALAKLHMTTISPTSKYGFPVATLQGPVPQFADWTDTWEEFFSRSFQRVVENEEKAQGPDQEMQELERAIFKKVIPRLLRPLETGGRSIRPCLVHGDIWDGNVATNRETKNPVIFDSTCIYAHNECKPLTLLSPDSSHLVNRSVELAPLRPARHRMRKEYIEAYIEEVDPSDPEEDHDDRNALYCL
jgi:protein-ribulosamine 3-kinase